MSDPRKRPIAKLAEAAGVCGPQAKVYGRCIMVDYNDVHKDKCAAQFLKLKDCIMKQMGRKKGW